LLLEPVAFLEMKEPDLISRPINPVGNHFRVPECLELPSQEVHVWQADLDAPAFPENRPPALLSKDEYERAGRYQFARDRRRYVAGRLILRILLSAYLKTNPNGVSFHYSQNGKPRLGCTSEIRFNVSHSDKMAVFAFVRGREVGVDVEQIHRDIAVQEIAGRFFSQVEQAAFAKVPKELKRDAFFRCWTRKEALVKAKGDGLSLPLDQFDVSLLAGQSARLLGTRPDPGERHRWSMWELDAGPGYAAALVAEGKGMRVVEMTASSAVEHGTHILENHG
jgi:4'-phosphopantetheinyl transferase